MSEIESGAGTVGDDGRVERYREARARWEYRRGGLVDLLEGLAGVETVRVGGVMGWVRDVRITDGLRRELVESVRAEVAEIEAELVAAREAMGDE